VYILSGDQILEHIDNRIIIISPFQTHLLNPSSYYFTLGRIIKVFDAIKSESKTINLEDRGEVKIAPNGYLLGNSYETLDLSSSKKVFASFGAPYSLIENGLLLCHSPTIDPYHNDFIQFGIKNLLPIENTIRFQMVIGKAIFFNISESPITLHHLSEAFKASLQKAVTNPLSSEIKLEQ